MTTMVQAVYEGGVFRPTRKLKLMEGTHVDVVIPQTVVPRDPKTPAQRDRRRQFRAAVVAWRALPDLEKDKWRKRAAKSERTGYHLFLSEFTAKREVPLGRGKG